MLKLMEFQKTALNMVSEYDRCAFYHTMGLG